MLNVAICDDEPAMAEELSRQLARYMAEQGGPPYRLASFRDGRSLLESGHDPDLIFLDIRLSPPDAAPCCGQGEAAPELDGMDTARLLRQRGCRGLVIFVTVLREYVFDAFGVEAWDYLLKPLDRERFDRAMDRAVRELRQREAKSLIIHRGGSCRVIPLSRLAYCEVQGRKVYLHQEDGTVTDYYDRLEELEKRLDSRFFRCHRSYLVNLGCVRGCHGGQITLACGGSIPVSRLRERELTQALLRYMKERGD